MATVSKLSNEKKTVIFMTWNCNVVFMQHKRSLFYEENHLVSRFFNSGAKKQK